MSVGPFIPPVNPPQQIPGSTIGNLLARIRFLEGARIPGKFEIVSDILLPVPTGNCADMLVAPDLDGTTLITGFAWVYTVSASDDIEVQVFSTDYAAYLLNTPITIPAGSTSSVPTPADIIPGMPLAMGDLIIIEVIDPGAGGLGLGVGLNYG